MKLTLESGEVIADATEHDILSLIEGEDFAILGGDPDTYIQCAEQRKPPYDYVLEYQDGSLDQHYNAVDGPITLDRVTAAFIKYLKRDPSWRSDFVWEKVDLSFPGGNGGGDHDSPLKASPMTLIQRLKERNSDRQRAIAGQTQPTKRVPPVATKNLQAAERSLGFKFPELLRGIYLKVGNGGFGPEYGIIGIKGGFKVGQHSLESCYQEMLQLKEQNPVWRWPNRLLPLANYGCGMWSCVDCDYQKLPMFLWDPNTLDSELEGDDARLNWGNVFWNQGKSLQSWLEGWLADQPEPEPKWPSDAWMKRRLGFTLPK